MKEKIIIIILAVSLGVSLFFNYTSYVDKNGNVKVVFSNREVPDVIDMPKYAGNEKWAKVEYQYINQYSYPTDVVFCGDSLIYNGNWNEMFPGLDVKNRGISGDTTEGLACRLDSIIKTQPSKVFLMIGTNDYTRFTLEERENNYKIIINTIKSELPSCEIYVNSLLPVSSSNERDNDEICEVNKMLEAVCADNGVTYIDIHSYFIDADGNLKEELTVDGLHLSLKGYEQWYEIIYPYVY